QFIESLQMLLDIKVIIFILIGILLGFVIGALPGLTDPMALGLAIPFTFGMEPLQAILFLLGIHFAAVYSGSMTAILINTPGTPAGAAAALDGYPLTQKGQSKKSLQMAAISALCGGTISIISLIVFAPIIANVAIKFGPSEYFALGIFGMSVIAGVAGKSLSKALFTASLGVFFSFIGTDPMMGVRRFTFDSCYLSDGIALIAALIGLFGISEIIIQSYNSAQVEKTFTNSKLAVIGLKSKEIKQSIKTIFKGGIIGTVVGALPGSGAVISSFLSYNEAVRSSKKPEKYGKGELDGVAASESGAVGTEASAFIPLLTLGIPGDVGSAIILSPMILHGIEVGPQLFSGSGEIVKALFGGMIIIEIGVFLAAWFGSTLVSKIVKIPSHYLFSVVSVLIVAGAFALENNMFNVWVTFAFGLLGYILLKFNYPLPPLLLGLILGPLIDKNFLLATSSSGGDWFAIITRPITAFILILAMISMFLSIRIQQRVSKRL